MKQTRKRLLALCVVLLFLLAACASPAPAEPSPPPSPDPPIAPETLPAEITPEGEVVTLVLSTVATEASTYAGQRLAEIAYRESGGTIIMNHFPDNVLGGDRVVVESAIFGDIDIVMSSTSPLVDLFPDFLLFDAHFLFRDNAHAHEIMGGPIGQQILDGMEEHGLKGFAFWEQGFRNLTNNRTPARSPEDVQGLVVRTMENPIHIAAWNAFGANPTPMSFAEVFTAMQQGTIDGQENPLAIIDANAFYEVQNYIVLTQHCYVPHLIAMNLDRWNSLSENQQRALQIAFAEATEIQLARAGANEAAIYERLQGQDVQIIRLTPEERALFEQAIADSPVLDMIRDGMNNPHLLDEVLATLN